MAVNTLDEVRERTHAGKCVFHDRLVDTVTTLQRRIVDADKVACKLTVQISCGECNAVGVENEKRTGWRDYSHMTVEQAKRFGAYHQPFEEAEIFRETLTKRNIDLFEANRNTD